MIHSDENSFVNNLFSQLFLSIMHSSNKTNYKECMNYLSVPWKCFILKTFMVCNKNIDNLLISIRKPPVKSHQASENVQASESIL